jgi:hypothetical protein
MTTARDKTLALPDSFFIRVGTQKGREKVVFGFSSLEGHLTITNNGDRRAINAHLTYDDGRVERLCELSYFTWGRFLVRMRQVLLPCTLWYFYSRKINLGRLKRRGFFLLTGHPGPDAEKELVEITKKGKRLQSKREIKHGTFQDLIKYPDDIVREKSPLYFLFSPDRRSIQGIIIRNPASPESKSYYFVTLKMFRQFVKKQNYLLYCILTELNFKNKDQLLRLFEEKVLRSKQANHPH